MNIMGRVRSFSVVKINPCPKQPRMLSYRTVGRQQGFAVVLWLSCGCVAVLWLLLLWSLQGGRCCRSFCRWGGCSLGGSFSGLVPSGTFQWESPERRRPGDGTLAGGRRWTPAQVGQEGEGLTLTSYTHRVFNPIIILNVE